MPYTIPIANDSAHWDGVALHVGVADGAPRSHTCTRQKGYVELQLFDMIGDRKVKVVIENMYDSKIKHTK